MDISILSVYTRHVPNRKEGKGNSGHKAAQCYLHTAQWMSCHQKKMSWQSYSHIWLIMSQIIATELASSLSMNDKAKPTNASCTQRWVSNGFWLRFVVGTDLNDLNPVVYCYGSTSTLSCSVPLHLSIFIPLAHAETAQDCSSTSWP